ncbi:hypothetical protein EJ04DRAFT_572175 [Polyplosphaeria fusca]|uniref:SET domain-containing protein n=1 Tax=Polyplosphaeria fusca TaxID=682080 RepID=A0A9P4V8G2_9PLEO|nr:hypothetical protein EJ04DRAFT_572175 [Polyplosphaeria fusca]
MALPTTSRNTYEELPEQLKDFQKNASTNGDAQWKPSRGALLREHEAHMKILSQGSLPVKTMTLPLSYPPSRVSIHDSSCRRLHLLDLNLESRDPNSIIILRTVTSPYIYSSTITVAEDETGEVARLMVCNLEDNLNDPIVDEGSILAIKQPSWSRLLEGGYQIRVDHPSDLVVIKAEDDITPQAWKSMQELDTSKDAMQWKKEGDIYDRGLDYLIRHPSATSSIDLYRKKCGVNIVLLRLDDAATDLSNAIAIYANTVDSVPSALSELSTINAWLHDNSTEDPLQIASNISRPLRELAARIKFDLGLYQTTPTYNLSLISSYVSPLTLHVDAANYTSETLVKNTETHGRGLFAKRDFKEGELICAEKAFVLPGYFIQDRSSDCMLYNLGEETVAPRPGALLFKELIQKLKWNPSLRREFFEMDDGGYWKENGWDVGDDEEVPVDVFRVERIRRLNGFSVPIRSSDLLNQPPNSNPELRNGFWIHASYINHCCLPNCVRTFIGDLHFLRATRDISCGEELTHQYLSPDIDIADRQDNYRGTWGFECDCALCKIDSAVPEPIRKQRMKLFEDLKASVMKLGERGPTVTAIKKIARGFRELETLYAPAAGEDDKYAKLPKLALVHPSLFLVEAWRSIKNTDKMIEYATKLLRNFGINTAVEGGEFRIVSNAGLVNVEVVRALKYLAEGYSVKGEECIAEQCMGIARKFYLIITGSEIGMEEFLKA